MRHGSAIQYCPAAALTFQSSHPAASPIHRQGQVAHQGALDPHQIVGLHPELGRLPAEGGGLCWDCLLLLRACCLTGQPCRAITALCWLLASACSCGCSCGCRVRRPPSGGSPEAVVLLWRALGGPQARVLCQQGSSLQIAGVAVAQQLVHIAQGQQQHLQGVFLL